MLMLVVALLGIASVPLTGGRLAALAQVRLRHAWLIPAALAVQIYITTIDPGGSRGAHVAAHLGSYLLAGAFVFANRDLPLVWLVALGGVLNLLVITVNGGVMPADANALQRAGWPTVSDQLRTRQHWLTRGCCSSATCSPCLNGYPSRTSSASATYSSSSEESPSSTGCAARAWREGSQSIQRSRPADSVALEACARRSEQARHLAQPFARRFRLWKGFHGKEHSTRA